MKMKFPFYTDKQERPAEPVVLPKPRQKILTNPAGYIPDPGLMSAVNVALLLGQPLLLTGEPGTGKTQLAYHVAHQLGLSEPFKFETKSTSEARNLFYFYDAIGHFRAEQPEKNKVDPIKFIKINALGEAIIHTNPKEKIEKFLNTLDQPYTKPRRSVVLIDEIDKAPRDFPNDILNEVELNYFRIHELNNEKIQADENLHPILILTSNSEKHLPHAFLRRCIYYDIPFPDRKNLEKIVANRLGIYAKSEEDTLAKALDFFLELRKRENSVYKPATAEFLNWLNILHSDMFESIENPLAQYSEALSHSLSGLVKNKSDLEAAQRLLKQWVK